MAEVDITSGQIEVQAKRLLDQLVDNYDASYGMGSMTASPYDTSWVACVARTVNGCTQYLFPSCFRFLLQTQSTTGGWACSTSSPDFQSPTVDEILSTLAAIYALGQLEKQPHQLKQLASQADLRLRIEKAVRRLSTLLRHWNVNESREVGFEVLVPSLLNLIARQGITFEFPERARLYEARGQKLAKLPPEFLYKKTPSTLLHSLEAFYGDAGFDYDRVAHHKVRGSLMCSPSATAAYLMRSSEWDHEAEAYLRLVIETSSGQGLGGVPSAFPSTLFELTWVFSTLLGSGLGKGLAEAMTGQKCCSILEATARANQGLIGFAPDVEPDVDDTAKASIVLSLLGRTGFAGSILREFVTKSGYVKTYHGERQASFTANCNALYAVLLELPQSATSANIEKFASFLCDSWWVADNVPQDKWNVSPYYASMLTAQSLIKLFERWESGLLPDLSETFLHDSVLLTLFQCLVRTLLSQKEDGSWGSVGPREESAYAVLTLTSLASLPLAQFISEQLNQAISRGRAFLVTSQFHKDLELLWIEKTMYGCSTLSQAYTLSAIYKSRNYHQPSLGSRTKALCKVNIAEMTKFTQFMERLPPLASHPRWFLVASWIEGRLFLPRLRSLRDTVFAREGMTEDKYFSWIPFIWTTSNNLDSRFLSSQFLFDMMTISFLNYQADEFMEAIVGARFGHDLQKIRDAIGGIFNETFAKDKVAVENGNSLRLSNGDKPEHLALNGAGSPVNSYKELNGDSAAKELGDIVQTLSRFVTHVVHHPHISGTSPDDRCRLVAELQSFLLAHVDQIEDNQKLTRQAKTDILSSSISHRNSQHTFPSSFKKWVRTTSANHTSCPYSFAFACSLRATAAAVRQRRPKVDDFFPSVTAKYIADDACRALATLCRMYNDLGSIARDRREGNLNSVNFPELHELSPSFTFEDHSLSQDDIDRLPATDKDLKARLYHLAEYERKVMQVALVELERIVEPDVMSMIQVFVGVTDLFGQIYVVKDIASQRTS